MFGISQTARCASKLASGRLCTPAAAGCGERRRRRRPRIGGPSHLQRADRLLGDELGQGSGAGACARAGREAGSRWYLAAASAGCLRRLSALGSHRGRVKARSLTSGARALRRAQGGRHTGHHGAPLHQGRATNARLDHGGRLQPAGGDHAADGTCLSAGAGDHGLCGPGLGGLSHHGGAHGLGGEHGSHRVWEERAAGRDRGPCGGGGGSGRST